MREKNTKKRRHPKTFSDKLRKTGGRNEYIPINVTSGNTQDADIYFLRQMGKLQSLHGGVYFLLPCMEATSEN